MMGRCVCESGTSVPVKRFGGEIKKLCCHRCPGITTHFALVPGKHVSSRKHGTLSRVSQERDSYLL
jgi:hypothetical protein